MNLAKASTAAELGLMLSKYCKTFDSLLYMSTCLSAKLTSTFNKSWRKHLGYQFITFAFTIIKLIFAIKFCKDHFVNNELQLRKNKKERMIDFYDMSNCQEFFYFIHCISIFTIIGYQVFLFDTNNWHTILWFQVFLSNNNNNMVLSNYFYLIIVICLHNYMISRN